MPAPTKPIVDTTQRQLPIEDIRQNLVILKDGSCCLVLQVTAINFGLLSEKEQDAIIFAYAALLNSLSFPLQIVVISLKKDVSSYLTLLDKQINSKSSEEEKTKIREYKEFIEQTVKTQKVLDKKFYLSIPFSSLSLGAAAALGGVLGAVQKLPYEKEYIIKKAETDLFPKRDHLMRQMNRLGLQAKQLTTEELVNLFYQLYNPEMEGQNLSQKEDYETTMVKPSVAGNLLKK